MSILYLEKHRGVTNISSIRVFEDAEEFFNSDIDWDKWRSFAYYTEPDKHVTLITKNRLRNMFYRHAHTTIYIRMKG